MESFSFLSTDGVTKIAAYRVAPKGTPVGMIQISHGMCEYFGRYRRFAEFLAENGFLVFGHDHLGHGNTAQKPEDRGFFAPSGGVDLLVGDIHRLTVLIKNENPGLPLILFGHSMGSFLARAVMETYGGEYDGGIICGTGGPETPAGLGKMLASVIGLFCGRRHRSRLLAGIAFAGYNKKFGKGCGRDAWLTRDEAVCKRYRQDPLCNFTFTVRGYYDLFTAVQRVSAKSWAKNLPRDLPLLVVSGEDDPVGGWGRGVRLVTKRLQDAGIRDVTQILYPGMRHEILNEIGYETVQTELLEWMKKHVLRT